MANHAPDNELQRKIDALKHAFTEALDQRLGELDMAMARLNDSVPLTQQADVIKAVLEQAHKIAGSAGTFGYSEVSVVASEIEQLCDRILQGGHGSDETARKDLTVKIVSLHAGAAK